MSDLTSNPSNAEPWEVVTRYGKADLTLHPLVREAYKVAVLIERCGCSPELTAASSTAFALCEALSEQLNLLLAERDAARIIAKKRRDLLVAAGVLPGDHRCGADGDCSECSDRRAETVIIGVDLARGTDRTVYQWRCRREAAEPLTSKNLLDRLRSAALTRGPLASVSVDKNDLLALVEWADKHGASTETSAALRADELIVWRCPKCQFITLDRDEPTCEGCGYRRPVETEPALEDQFREHQGKDHTGCDL